MIHCLRYHQAMAKTMYDINWELSKSISSMRKSCPVPANNELKGRNTGERSIRLIRVKSSLEQRKR